MADDISLDFDFSDFERKLEGFTEKVRGTILKESLAAGGLVLKDAVIAAAPERTDDYTGGNSLPPGALKEDIGGDVHMNAANGSGVVRIGPSQLTAYVGWWLEKGHDLTTHGSRTNAKVIGHVKETPFMAPAFDAASQQALNAFNDKLAALIAEEDTAESND